MAASTGPRPHTNGVLQISTSQLLNTTPKLPATRPPAERTKVIVRRLAPALTEAEFVSILGDEWQLGKGKVDWFIYKPGKNSKEYTASMYVVVSTDNSSLSKPSRPSRAYLHLTNADHLLALADHVRDTVFEDAQNTYNSAVLIGPPIVEFAPYSRTPSGRSKTDLRAGTIDQDTEFMSFLESLANPESTAKEIADGYDTTRKAAVTTTPLVQYLKDKKASKSKEAAAKAMKKQEVKGKGKDVPSHGDDAKKKGKDTKADKLIEKAAKEAVKILNREAAVKTAPSSSSTAKGAQAVTTDQVPKLDVNRIPSAQRGAAIAAHVRMLKRDLGLGTAQAHRQIKREIAEASKGDALDKTSIERSHVFETKAAGAKASSDNPVPTTPKGLSQQQNKRTRGKGVNPDYTSNRVGMTTNALSDSSAPKASATSKPLVLLKKPEVQSNTAPTLNSATASSATASTASTTPDVAGSTMRTIRKPRAPDSPSESARQAFIKHANPSQGVTEQLLKEALEKFGAVAKVEIDKRKGFGYVDFVEPQGLKAAIGANPINVAQGTVQVMQRKGSIVSASSTSSAPAKQAPKTSGTSSRGGRGLAGSGRRGGRGGSNRRGGNVASSSSAQPTSASDMAKGSSAAAVTS